MTLTPEQLAARQQGIGSSECAAAIGVNPYKSRYELWREKTGLVEAENLDEVERIKWGQVLEEPIARAYCERTGERVQRMNTMQVHREYPFMLSHIDRKVIGKPKVLEVKNVGHHYGRAAFGEEFTDQVPDVYLVQVQHQLIVNEYKDADLAALIGGNSLKIYCFRIDDELADLIVRRCSEFWDYVQRNEPPPPLTVNELELMHAQDNGQIKTVDASVFEMWQKYHEAARDLKASEETVQDLEILLKFAIAESAGIQLGNELPGPERPAIQYAGTTLATWKTQTRTTIDAPRLRLERPEIYAEYAKESRFRVLRVKK